MDGRAASRFTIESIEVDTSQFRCPAMTPKQAEALLRFAIADGCSVWGVVEGGPARLQVAAAIRRVDARDGAAYSVVFGMGYGGRAAVQVDGTITCAGGMPDRFFHTRCLADRRFGGGAETAVQKGLLQIGRRIAGEMAAAVGAGVSSDPQPIRRYLTAAVPVAAAVAALAYSLVLRWVSTLPSQPYSRAARLHAHLAQFALPVFAGLLLVAMAAAPRSVLNNRATLWLFTLLNARTPAGVRARLAGLAVISLAWAAASLYGLVG